MRIDTDDEVYRVDAVWLGPKDFGFPWRARYVAYGLGVPIFFGVVAVERLVGVGVGIWSTVWAVIITVAVTKFVCAKINYERPVTAVWRQVANELTTPRKQVPPTPKPTKPRVVRVSEIRPTPGSRAQRREANRTRRAAQRGGLRRIVSLVGSRRNQERRNDEAAAAKENV